MMRIRSDLLVFLAISIAALAMLGCGVAPASQSGEAAATSQAPAPRAETQTTESAQPATKMFQADSVPPKATQPMESKPEQAVEVGYKVGMQAPEFGMSLLDGTKVTQASIAEAGKPAFIYFHATW